MSPFQLEQYLHEHIPLSQAMQVHVVEAEEHVVVLSAPLEPNINHRDTGFGGSASAIAILAAWSLLHTRLSRDGIMSRLVIQRNTMEYKRPIVGEFSARSRLDDEQEWGQFTSMLARRGRARIRVTAVVECAGEMAGEFVGEFVALGAEFYHSEHTRGQSQTDRD